MKNSKKTFISSAALAGLLLLLTFAAMPTRAAAPELINFQGKLTDPTGKAITSAVTMLFKLYTVATGGTAAWQETQTVTPDETGIYSVQLGAVTPFAVDFSTAYWLGVAVGADAEMTPRYQLVSSAYSIYSINSGTAAWATGADWSGIANKPSFASGDVTLASTQTFTGLNTFSSGLFFDTTIQSVGGAPRGAHAVDLQTYWTDPTHVASGGHSVIAGGKDNTASGGGSIVSGGVVNNAIGVDSSVSGGVHNTAGSDYSTVSGGAYNQTAGQWASVSGGTVNWADGDYSNVSGGGYNIASTTEDTVGGGGVNTASGGQSTVSGGQHNIAGGAYSTVAGGYQNTASGSNAIVAGGSNNTALGNNSFAAGNYSNATADGSFTWADSEGTEVDNTVADRTWFKNKGGFRTTASTNTADGGLFLSANNYVGISTAAPTSTFTVVGTFKLQDGTQGAGKVLTSNAAGAASWVTPAAGGDVVLAATQTFSGQNTFSKGLFFDSGIWSTGPGANSQVGNPRGDRAVDLQTVRNSATQVASGIDSVIGGGAGNTASANLSSVTGGYDNTASGYEATVSGGEVNTASGNHAAVIGGQTNTASGTNAIVAGGLGNTATGAGSFAAGYNASALANGAFTWSDSWGSAVTSNNVDNRTWFKNKGGFQTTASTNTADGGLFLSANNYVGISTAAPTSTFTVVGTFKLQDGTQGAGRVLTSDAAGLASWATPAAGGDVVLAATQTFSGQNTFTNGVFFNSTIQSTGSVNGNYGPGVSGNSRGANAVDLQTYRDNAAQVASGDESVIGGGMGNIASGINDTVSGGANNTASGGGATVSGGGSNTATALNATVSGGNTNMASGQFSAVSGGTSNTASGMAASVSGGEYNIASGQYAIAAGGQFNTALGDFSFAAGKASSSTAAGTFTWGDAEIGGLPVINNVADRTWFKNRGGFLISTTTVASSAAFAVDSTGKVGIGTISPGAALEVNGNILLSQGADRTISVATTTTNVAGNNLTIAAGSAQYGGLSARPAGNLYLTAGDPYTLGPSMNGGAIYLYGGNGKQWGDPGNVVLAHDGTNPKGNVGIGTIAPAATLDINGFMRLKMNSSPPVGCGISTEGAIALTDTHRMCVCDGSAWKFITDGTTGCVW